MEFSEYQSPAPACRKKNPHTLPGSEVYNANLADFTDLLEDYHHLSDKQVMNFSGWIYGDEIQKLDKSTHIVVKAIDPNAERNHGIENGLYICFCILSGAVNMNFKNHMNLQSYKYLLTEKKSLCYTD